MRILTMNDPKRRNTISTELRAKLVDELEAALADDSVRSIVLTGAGGTFSSGGDLSTMPVDDPAAGLARLQLITKIVTLITKGAKPVIAAVEGYAYGAGLSFAAACDYVVASREAKFCSSFGKVGLAPDGSLLWTLPQRVGLARAKAIMMFSEVIGAEQAHGYGLVEELAEPDGALAAAIARAETLAAAAPLPLETIKRLLADPAENLEASAVIETDIQVKLFGSNDFIEGRDAFFEKRPAKFTGS